MKGQPVICLLGENDTHEILMVHHLTLVGRLFEAEDTLWGITGLDNLLMRMSSNFRLFGVGTDSRFVTSVREPTLWHLWRADVDGYVFEGEPQRLV